MYRGGGSTLQHPTRGDKLMTLSDNTSMGLKTLTRAYPGFQLLDWLQNKISMFDNEGQ